MRSGITHNARLASGAIQTWIDTSVSNSVVLDLNGSLSHGDNHLSVADARTIIGILQAALDELDRTA